MIINRLTFDCISETNRNPKVIFSTALIQFFVWTVFSVITFLPNEFWKKENIILMRYLLYVWKKLKNMKEEQIIKNN